MTTLYIDHRGVDVDAEGDTVVVRAEGERRGTVPLRPLERLIVASSARLTTRLLAKLAANGTGLLVLAGLKKAPSAALLGRPHGDTELRAAQFLLLDHEEARAALAKPLVASKIEGQRALLREAEERCGRSRALERAIVSLTQSLETLAREAPSRARLRGLEGAASAAYFAAFKTLFPRALAFKGRNRRPPRDPVNVCLSLGYTLLHFDALREVAAHGFDPLVGFYHDLSPGRESLACDLAEPFRPRIDGFVLSLFLERKLRPEHFSKAGPACRLGKAGRKVFYESYESWAPSHRQALERLSRELANAIRGHAPADVRRCLGQTREGERSDGGS